MWLCGARQDATSRLQSDVQRLGGGVKQRGCWRALQRGCCSRVSPPSSMSVRHSRRSVCAAQVLCCLRGGCLSRLRQCLLADRSEPAQFAGRAGRCSRRLGCGPRGLCVLALARRQTDVGDRRRGHRRLLANLVPRLRWLARSFLGNMRTLQHATVIDTTNYGLHRRRLSTEVAMAHAKNQRHGARSHDMFH